MKYFLSLGTALLLCVSAQAGDALRSLANLTPDTTGESTIPPPPVLKEWTVMVYMNGKSNIEPYALRDLNRFETVGSTEKMNIVVELGRSRGLDNDTAEDGDWSGVRRYFVTKDVDPGAVNSRLLADLGEADMGDWKQAASFLKWARAEYPAKKYLFIIWDHGWGWIDPKKEAPAHGQKSISHDFVTGNYISTLDLGKVFKEGGKVDVYASMACFMQMAEVAYELKDAANIIVASEEVVQLPSFNFEDILAFLAARPGSGADALGRVMVDTFREMYSRPEIAGPLAEAKYGVQLSAIRASQLRVLAQKLKAWKTLASAPEHRSALARAKAGVLRFEVGDETTDPEKKISFYGDLHHFVDLAGRHAAGPAGAALRAAGEDLKHHIAEHVVVHNAALGQDRTGKTYDEARGLGVQIPGRPGTLIEYYPTYSKLAFARDSGWEEFTRYLDSVPE